MASLGDLFVSIKGDTKDFDKAIDKTQKKTKNYSQDLKKFGSNMNKFVILPILALGTAATKVASDLGESVNAVNVVFGESSDIIQDWGEQASTQAGLSKRAFNESSAVIGTLLKKTGQDLDDVAASTIEITTRSADLASVFNKDLSVATGAVGAALRGETEPIRQFGIDVSAAAVEAEALSSGLVENKKDITEAVKVQARYNLILQQSSGLAGDFAKTNDDLANSSRVLKADIENAGAELGEVFLPFAAKGVGLLRDLTKAAQEQAPIVKDRLVAAWVNFAADTSTVITKLGGAFDIFGANIKSAWITAVNSIQIAFNNLATAITTNALGAVSKFLDVAGKLPFVGAKFKEASDSVDGLSDSLKESSKEAIQNSKDIIQAGKDEIAASKAEVNEKIANINIERDAKLQAIADARVVKDEEKEKEKQDILEIKAEEAALEDSREEARLARKEKEAIDAEERATQRELEQQAIIEGLSNLAAIADGLYQIQINQTEAEKNAKIDALNKELLGEEEYARQVAEIEKQAALETWKLQTEQAKVKKATDTGSVIINTAVAATKALAELGPIFGPIAAGLMAAAGAVQIGVIASTPLPPKPQLATGGFVQASSRGTEVIVGEDGDEEVFGMGSKGIPRRKRFAMEVASMVNANGGSQPIVMNINSLYPPRRQDLDRLAEDLFSSNIKAQQRRGIN